MFINEGSKARYGAYYGLGSNPMILSHLHCDGSESNLLDCTRDMFGFASCGQYRVAGVKCPGR